MRGKIFFALAFLILASLSFVQAEEKTVNLDALLGNISVVNDYLETNDVQVPQSAQKIITEGNITLNITRLDGTVTALYVEIVDKKVMKVYASSPEKKAYGIFVSEETINELAAQENPDILEAYDDGKIKIKAYGFGNKVKFFFAKILLKFVD